MITDSLSEKSRETWAELWKRYMGREWENPTKQAIRLEGKLEAPEELERIMKERPPYVIDVQGRE